MKKKKVLQFIHGMTMGGAETLIKEYCLKLDKTKYDVSVLCFYRYHMPYEQLLEDAGVKVTYIEDIEKYPEEGSFKRVRRVLLMLQRIVYVRKYLKREQPDIIHTHLNNNTYIWAAKPRKGTKIFHTVHSELDALWEDDFESKLDLYATKKLVEKFHMRFFVLHEQMRKDTNAFFNVNDSVILNNGIDFEKFENALPKAVVRKREGIPENAFVIGHVGRFTKNKNHTFLVDVFAEIKKNTPEAYLLLVGNGETLEDIQDKIKHLGLDDCSKILSYRTDVPDLLSAMDRFVFPSIYEGLGIVLIEAQKIGIPCIASSAVPDAAKISNLMKTLDLHFSADIWADEIEKFQIDEIEYYGAEEWEIKQVVNKMERIYEE